MKIARLIPVAVALVAAGGAGILAMNFVQAPAPAPAVAADVQQAEPTIRVLVAAQDISMGGRASTENLRWDEWPQRIASAGGDFITEDVQPNALTDFQSRIAMTNVFTGEPISERKFVSAESGFMSALLPAGKRAVATEINLVSGAGGFILPNDRVDVIMTRAVDGGDTTESVATETILENVRVLAIGQTIREEEGSAVIEGSTATLELSPDQARIVTAAREVAKSLTLSLRSLRDADEEGRTNGRSLVKNADQFKSGTVLMIQGGESSLASTK